jgi:hydrogenase-1 operon protein HyaE
MTPHQPPIHPLIARLIDEFGYPQLDAGNLETWNAAPGDAVLFCAGDPVQYPECLDVAVVLPEILRAFPGRFRAGIASKRSWNPPCRPATASTAGPPWCSCAAAPMWA